MSSNTETTPKPLTILCFGDSLTAGYSQWGMKMTPYATTTSEILSEQLELPKGTEIQMCVEGVSGQLVTNGFLGRMERLYNNLNSNDTKWSWLVFLGGTNDLGYSKSPSDIYAAILAVTEIPRTRDGAKMLMCTIPECAVKRSTLDTARDELNSLIKNDTREGVYILDLHQKMPYHSLDPAVRDILWDDGLHFTEAGYTRIGQIVARRLIGIIERGEGREDDLL